MSAKVCTMTALGCNAGVWFQHLIMPLVRLYGNLRKVKKSVYDHSVNLQLYKQILTV